MNARAVIPAIVAALAVLALVLFVAARNQRVLEDGLPQSVPCLNQVDAFGKAQTFAATRGGRVVAVLGTGSMAPYIPAAKSDPLNTVVAYAVVGGTFEQIAPGKLCVYRYGTGNFIHGAAQQDGAGWIMSGLHNARSESWARVTRENFVGVVSAVFVWEVAP